MKLVSKMAMAVALSVGGMAVVAVPPAMALQRKEKKAEQKAPELSKAARAALAPAQEALGKSDFETARAKLTEADAVAQTTDEKYFTAQLWYNLAQSTNDEALKKTAIDKMLASGGATPEQLPQLYGAQAQYAYNAKDYAKAETALTELTKLTPTNADNLIMLAEIKNVNKKPAEALQVIDQAVQAKKAAGQPVSEEWYKKGMSIAYGAKSPEVSKWGSAWVAAYPSSESWRAVLQIFQENNQLDPQTSLDLYRLQRAAKALAGERDFYEYANTAYERGLPGEAVSVIDEGMATNMLNSGNKAAVEVKGLAAEKVSSDKAQLAALDTSARKAANGKAAAGTGDAYLGYGEWAKAADLYKVALEKGQVDADQVNTRLGIALARQGQKDAAKAAFSQVKAGNRAAIAQYWTIWLDQQA